MGKYNHTFSQTSQLKAQKQSIHPAWYIAGVFFMILVPLLSFGIAELLFQNPEAKAYLAQATDLYARPGNFLYAGDPYIYIKLLITVSLSLVMYAVFTMVTFMINSMFGSSRYGPYDLPPVEKPRGVRMRKAR